MMQVDTKTSPLSGYLPTLDGWRAIAIAIVLVFHARDALIRVLGSPMAHIAPYMELVGPYGVDLFFAISGLLITSRLLVEEGKTGGISLKGFYIRRAFRILPPSMTYLAVIGVLGSLHLIAFRLHSWEAALLFATNFTRAPLWYVGHFWSLAVEEHFYFFWPFLLVITPLRRRLSLAVGLCLLIALWRAANLSFLGIEFHSSYYSLQGRTDFQVDAILWGAALALAFNTASLRDGLRVVLTPSVALVLSVLVLGSLFVTHNDWKLLQLLVFFRYVATPLILLTTVLNCRGVIAAVLENPALKMIGKLSYSIYLWQQLFLVWNIQSLPYVVWPHRFPFDLCCAGLCAVASYYLLEKPFIRIGHSLAKKAQAPSPMILPVREGA